MEFPVDLLATVDPGSLEQSAESYLSKLCLKNSETQEYLSIPGSEKIEIGPYNVSFVYLYGVNIKILALFSPEETLKAVGLYLLDKWWSAEDILKTADPSRTGLIKVRTPGERIVLYVLNRIIYRNKEMVEGDVPFPCHKEDELVTILWENGEAIGFYSVKPEGNLCDKFLTQRYQLPVMDTIFIRKYHRGHGHGLQMLKDFIDSFRYIIMGLSYPVSPAMYKVCKKYLSLYPKDTELLWEIEGVGYPFERTQIARKLQTMDLNGNHQVTGKLNFDTKDSDIPKEAGITEVRETMEFTEVVEEVIQIKIKKGTVLGRHSNLKRKKLGADTEETTEKIIRVEDIESDVQCAEDDRVREDSKLSLNFKEPALKDTMETITHDPGQPISFITDLHCEEQNKLSPESSHQSGTENKQMAEITPVMEILTGNDLQPLEREQEVEVEIVQMLSETEEVKEKAGEVKESNDDVDEEILLDERETSERIVETQNDQIDMTETNNKEDIEDEVEMGKILEEEKVSTTIQEEENSNMAYSSGPKGKHDDKHRSNYETPSRHSRRLNDQSAESKLTERVLQSSSKETVITTFQQVHTRQPKSIKQPELLKHIEEEPTDKGIKQTESQVILTEEEQVEEIAENENVELCSENLIAADKENEKGMNIEQDCLDQPTTDDQTLMVVDNKTEDGSQDETLRNEAQNNVTAAAAAEEAEKTNEDREEIGIVDVNNAEPSAAEHIEEQGEEPASAQDGSNREAALKTAAVALVESTEKQHGQEMTDNENLVVVEDKIKDSNNEEREVRHDRIETNMISKDAEPFLTDENKIEEAQEEEPMKEPNTIEIEEQIEFDIESNLDYEVDETTKDDEKIAVVDVFDTDVFDVRAAEIEIEEKSPEPSAAEYVEEQEKEPASETWPTEEDNSSEGARTQNVAVVRLDFNKVPPEHESDDSEMDKGSSQPQEKVLQEPHKPESSYHRNEGREGVSQTECEVEPTEKEQVVEMTETEEVRGERMEIEENIMSKVEDEFLESAFNNEKKMDEAQEDKPVKQTNTNQDIPDEEPKIPDESSEDDDGLKSDAQIELSEEEEETTSFVTPLRRSRRLKRQAADSDLTKRVLRSSTKAAKATSKTKAVKQQVTKQPADDPEAVEGKIESVSIIHETEHMKAVVLEVERETTGQCATEPVEEQEEEPASDNTEETTSALKLQKVAVVLIGFHQVSTTHTDTGKHAKGTLQTQKEVDMEDHGQCTDTESQAEHTEKEQVAEMTECEEGVVLNEDRVPELAVNDEENMEEVQKETDTARELPSERSDVPIKLDEEEEDEASSVTLLRRSRRLKDQAAHSELTKSVLRRSARLTNEATPQQRHGQQIKTMMELEEPQQLDESKNNEMNIMLGAEVAVGQSETVHVFAEGDPENRISVVQSTCEAGRTLEKDNVKAADHENTENIRKLHGNDVEEDIRRDDVTEEDTRVSEDIIHGEAEQICTPEEKTAVDIKLSEYVKEGTVQKERAASEMVHGEDLMETASALTQQEASVLLVDVIKVLPKLTGEFSSAFENSQEKISNKFEMSEQAVEIPELQTEGENIETEPVNPTEDDSLDLNTAAKDIAEGESCVVMSNIEDETTDTSKLEEEKYSDESKVEEESKTEQNILQDSVLTQDSDHEECLETATRVQCILHLHYTEQEEEPATESAPEEDRENAFEFTSMLKLHQTDVLVDFQRQTDGNEADGNETTQSQEGELLTKANVANEEKALVEIDATEPVTERKDQEDKEEAAATAVELGIDNTLITNDEQDEDIHAEEDVENDSKEIEDSTVKAKSTSTELNTNKTLEECQETTTPAQGNSVQESRNLRCRTTTVNKNTEEEISDEEAEAVFTRHLRGRTVIVTPRRKSKHLTVTQGAEPEMEGHVTKICHEIVAVQSTDEARTAVEETYSKYDNTEVPAVSEAERNDQQQDKDIPGNDTEEEVTDGGKDLVGEAVDQKEVETTDREILGEGDLPDENQEKDVKSANSKQESGQQDNAPEETLLEETFEKEISKRVEEKCLEEAKDSAMNISNTEAVLDQSEEGEGVERWALRKRTKTNKPASVRKSKRLYKQDQDGNDEQNVVCANTEEISTKQSEKNAKEITEACVALDETFTLELDEEIDSNDAECNQVVEEATALFQESKKETTDAEQESGVMIKHFVRGRKSAAASLEKCLTRRSRELLPDFQSGMEDGSEVEEVIGGKEEKKPQQKRKAADKLTPRRSKRLGRAEIL